MHRESSAMQDEVSWTRTDYNANSASIRSLIAHEDAPDAEEEPLNRSPPFKLEYWVGHSSEH